MKRCLNCGWEGYELNEGTCPDCGSCNIEMERYYIETKMTRKEVDMVNKEVKWESDNSGVAATFPDGSQIYY